MISGALVIEHLDGYGVVVTAHIRHVDLKRLPRWLQISVDNLNKGESE